VEADVLWMTADDGKFLERVHCHNNEERQRKEDRNAR